MGEVENTKLLITIGSTKGSQRTFGQSQQIEVFDFCREYNGQEEMGTWSRNQLENRSVGQNAW